jgi:hypothetical protein
MRSADLSSAIVSAFLSHRAFHQQHHGHERKHHGDNQKKSK